MSTTLAQFRIGSAATLLALALLMAIMAFSLALGNEQGAQVLAQDDEIATSTPTPTPTPPPTPEPTSTSTPLPGMSALEQLTATSTPTPTPDTAAGEQEPEDESPTPTPTTEGESTGEDASGGAPTPTATPDDPDSATSTAPADLDGAPPASPSPDATIEPDATASPTAPAATPPVTATPAPLTDELDCAALEPEQTTEGWRFESSCDYTVSQDRESTTVHLTVDPDAAGVGWTIQARLIDATDRWSEPGVELDVTDTSARVADERFTVEIAILAPEHAGPGDAATVELETDVETEGFDTREGPTATLTASIPQPGPQLRSMEIASAASSGISCVEPPAESIQPGATVTLSCTGTIVYNNENANVDGWIAATVAQGWATRLQIDLPGGSDPAPVGPNLSGEATVGFKRSSGVGIPISLLVSVTVPETSTPGTSVPLTIESGCSPSHFCSDRTFRYTTTVSVSPDACSDRASSPVSVHVTAGSLERVSFSRQSQTSTGTLQFRVDNPDACSGWSVAVSASPLVYIGSAPNQPPIPPERLSLVNANGQTVQLSAGMKSIITNGSDVTSQIQAFDLQLQIPAGSAAGQYTGTLTFTTSAAPGTP